MTEPTASPTPVTPDKAGLFEDFIDIFGSPAKVFARRAQANPMTSFLIVSIVLIALFFASKNAMAPIFDAQYQKGIAAAMKSNPSLTADQMSQGRKYADIAIIVTVSIVIPVSLLLIALVGFALARVFGGTITYATALMVASYAYVPRIVGSIGVMIQTLVMDSSKFTSMHQLELGPGRFFDPVTSSPLLLGLLSRFDIITLWVTVLLAIGLVTVGKVPRAKVAAIAVAFWLIGAIPVLFGAWREASAAG